MKRTVLFAFLCVAALACDKKEDTTPQPEVAAVSVPYRQATKISASGTDLKVELKDVADSRCPINANCITMGSARLAFTVSDASSQVDVNLEFKGDSKNNATEFKIGGTTYVLSVSEVLPYPETSKSPRLEDYKIAVAIERK